MPNNVQQLLTQIRGLSNDQQRELQQLLQEGCGDSAGAAPNAATVGTGKCEESIAQQYLDLLADAGLTDDAKAPRDDRAAFENFRPVSIAGNPLSETIIEERQ